mmetsp:Transcript_13900/g.30202  ORF Transcript_13900/g.30202 Transcript_13900/m.30202 type:complete len:382 (-) Transcript_13900:970-2115(-)
MGGKASKVKCDDQGVGTAETRKDDGATEPISSFTTSTSSLTTSLHLGLLDDDLLVVVLSYVGNGPFDDKAESHEPILNSGHHNTRTPSSSCCLTHTLPHVSKQFRYLCDTSEVLWLEALHRMLRCNPMAWEERVLALVEGRLSSSITTSRNSRSGNKNNGGRGGDFGDVDQSPPWAWGGRDSPLWKFRVRFKGRPISLLSEKELKHYVDLICQVVGHRHEYERSQRQPIHTDNETLPPNEITHAKRAVMYLTKSRIVRTLPLLHFPISAKVRIGHLLRLDLFDARCGPSISAITAKRTKKELRSGTTLAAPRPEFVLTSREAEPTEGTTAYLVELHRCHLRAGRRAEFLVVPMERIRITELEEREEEDGVFDASFRLEPNK